jgi:hypothetical protein
VSSRCAARRSVPADGEEEIRISVEVYVQPHRLVHLTAGRALMVLLQELQDDRIPVFMVRVALSGAALSRSGDCS